MRKFIFNSGIFLLISIVLFHVEPLYLLHKDEYKSVVAGDEIYYSLQKSKSKSKSKKVLFGDSVGRQLFDCKKDNDSVNSLASNQAIALVGQYILLKNYLDAGNQVDTVYFIMRPFSFMNNLDQVYTYHYFLKPFYRKEYLQYFTRTVKEQIAKIPYCNFSQYPPVLTSNWAPDFKPEDEVKFTFLSPISVEYLIKIKELAEEKKFKLIILPTPLSNSYKKDIENINMKEIADNNFDDVFDGYFEKIIYLDDSSFSDGAHLVEPAKYTEYYKKKFLNQQ